MAHRARIVLELVPNAHYRSLPPVYGYEVTVTYESSAWGFCPSTEQAAIEQAVESSAQLYLDTGTTKLGEPLRIVSRVFKTNFDPARIEVEPLSVTASSCAEEDAFASAREVVHDYASDLKRALRSSVDRSKWMTGVRQRAAA